jgi:catechol 2,3-dioxygenase-like lactoylglutathione lyase family enzyme
MIQGLHHITLITADAARNADFYTRVLGQRFVKKTVNFDDPTSYHLYYGDEHDPAAPSRSSRRPGRRAASGESAGPTTSRWRWRAARRS